MEKKTNNKEYPVDLSALYPTPKTFDERYADRQRLDLKRIARLPRHIEILSAARLSLLFTYTLWLAGAAPQMIYGSLIGAYSLFLLLLAWCGVVWWTLSSVTSLIQSRNYNQMPFILFYATWVIPFGVVSASLAGLGTFVSLVMTHFITTYSFMSIIYTTRLTIIRKVLMLMLIWVLTLIPLIVISRLKY